MSEREQDVLQQLTGGGDFPRTLSEMEAWCNKTLAAIADFRAGKYVTLAEVFQHADTPAPSDAAELPPDFRDIEEVYAAEVAMRGTVSKQAKKITRMKETVRQLSKVLNRRSTKLRECIARLKVINGDHDEFRTLIAEKDAEIKRLSAPAPSEPTPDPDMARQSLEAVRAGNFQTSEELIAELKSKVHAPSQPASEASELPTSEGVWIHPTGWAYMQRKWSGELSAGAWKLAGMRSVSLGWLDTTDDDFPRGGWHPAVPAAEVARLEAELAETREQLQTVHAHVKEALELLGVDVSLAGYIPDSWTLREQCHKAKRELAEAPAAEVARLRHESAMHEESADKWRQTCATAVSLKMDYWKALQRIASGVGHEVAIGESATKAVGIAQAVQSEVARLEAELAEARRERDQYKEWEQVRFDGAKYARLGGRIEDCPYGPNKATSDLRDSTKTGLWQQGFDIGSNYLARQQLTAANDRLRELEGAARCLLDGSDAGRMASTDDNEPSVGRGMRLLRELLTPASDNAERTSDGK